MSEGWASSTILPRVKLQGPTVAGRTVRVSQLSPTDKTTGKMIGEANGCDVQLENIECRALLDTGTTVSTICQQFYESHFPEVPLQSMEDVLKVECAGGQLLPYLGYVEVDVSVLQLGMSTTQIITSACLCCLVQMCFVL